MQLTINLPDREEQLAFNRERWRALCADRRLSDSSNRIETNTFGEIIMTPPAGGGHAKRTFSIAFELQRCLGGQAMTECPISTADGVRVADAVWFSDARYGQVRGQLVFECAPEICVEVLSPRNTAREIEHKFRLYFDAGAEECWQCDLEGQMSYYHRDQPHESTSTSNLYPSFPGTISD